MTVDEVYEVCQNHGDVVTTYINEKKNRKRKI